MRFEYWVRLMWRGEKGGGEGQGGETRYLERGRGITMMTMTMRYDKEEDDEKVK